MKKIVPFTKEIKFKTMLSKITSISLEHSLKIEDDNYIKGNFIIEGTYKLTEASQIDEEFSYKIPVEIQIDSKYDISNVILDIDDFTYEIVDEDSLNVNISLSIDNLEEKEIEFDSISEDEIESVRFDKDIFLDTSKQEELEIPKDNIDETISSDYNNVNIKYDNNASSDEDEIDTKTTNTEVVTSLFASFKDSAETFKAYSVYLVKEDDTIDSILKKYNIDKDMLEEYNNISDIKAGSKIIIPCGNNE